MKKRTIMNPHIISGLVILSQMDKPRKASMLLVLGAQSKAIKLQNRLQQDSRRPRTSFPQLDFEENFLIRHGNRTTPRNTSRAITKDDKKIIIVLYRYKVAQQFLFDLLLTNNNFKTHQVEFIFLFKEFSREGTVGPFDVSITNEGKQSHANNKRCITTIEQNMPVSKNMMIKSIEIINFQVCFGSVTYA